jgi:hypothetical protein
VAVVAQALLVAFVIEAAFSKRHDVIALRGERGAARLLAVGAQRATREEICTHAL